MIFKFSLHLCWKFIEFVCFVCLFMCSFVDSLHSPIHCTLIIHTIISMNANVLTLKFLLKVQWLISEKICWSLYTPAKQIQGRALPRQRHPLFINPCSFVQNFGHSGFTFISWWYEHDYHLHFLLKEDKFLRESVTLFTLFTMNLGFVHVQALGLAPPLVSEEHEHGKHVSPDAPGVQRVPGLVLVSVRQTSVTSRGAVWRDAAWEGASTGFKHEPSSGLQMFWDYNIYLNNHNNNHHHYNNNNS